jgi:Winged helix DNA-binding domain
VTPGDIARIRLSSQLIAEPTPEPPAAVVRRLGAVQAQDYLGALWAIGLRQRAATEGAVERALADRTIVRTWPMRGTLHIVAAEDVRWMLELLTPRVVAGSAARHRELELDARVFARSGELFLRALEGGRQVARPHLYEILNAAKISTAGSRGLHILGYHAQARLICFGAREGKQQTFALLDEWVPQAKAKEREEALAELAVRYFTGHGPATVHDFAWWSGLSVADARTGVELAKPRLTSGVIDDRTYWFAASARAPRARPERAYLLPAFDEYTVAYRDRSAVLDPALTKRVNAGGGMLNPTMVLGGRVVGTWKRTLTKASVAVGFMPFARLAKADHQAFAAAADRYAAFLETGRRPSARLA